MIGRSISTRTSYIHETYPSLIRKRYNHLLNFMPRNICINIICIIFPYELCHFQSILKAFIRKVSLDSLLEISFRTLNYDYLFLLSFPTKT